MTKNNSDTQDHTATLSELRQAVEDMHKLISELLEMSKAARAARMAIAADPDSEPRARILAALEAKGPDGKMRGKLTMADIKALLHCGNSTVTHHVNYLAKRGKVVKVERPGEHGKLRIEVFHPDAVALQ